MKNIFIVTLFIISAALAYMQFGISKGQAECLPTKESKKLPPLEIIQLAEIHGISLLTPIDETDGLLDKAGYSCSKTDNKASTGNSQSRITNWRCANEAYKARINISAENNEITKISRSGAVNSKDMNDSVNLANYLKSLLNTRKGLSIMENEKTFVFNVGVQKDNGQISSARYQFRFMSSNNAKFPDTDDIGGEITVMITR